MKNSEYKETIIINRDSLKNYKKLSLGLENCENFVIDIDDVIDISCEVYGYAGSNKYDDGCRTFDGYIKLSSRARDILSDFAYTDKNSYIPEDYDEDDYKLYKRLSQCNDMCVFSLLDLNDRWIHIYVPYDALENAVHRSEIDYANCPSFEILENGDMEIRFGKLSKNPIIPRNNYSDLVEDWGEVIGDFNPKRLRLKVHSSTVEYSKDEYSTVDVHCTILNKEKKNIEVSFIFIDCDNINIDQTGKINSAGADMSKMCNGNIYFGIDEYLWVSCKSCRIVEHIEY